MVGINVVLGSVSGNKWITVLLKREVGRIINIVVVIIIKPLPL